MPFQQLPDPNLVNMGKEKFKDKLRRAKQDQHAQEATAHTNGPKGIAKILHFFKRVFSGDS